MLLSCCTAATILTLVMHLVFCKDLRYFFVKCANAGYYTIITGSCIRMFVFVMLIVAALDLCDDKEKVQGMELV